MAIVKFGFGPNMAYLPRQCVACNRVFAITSNNNRYCSEYCKMTQGINWSQPIVVRDVYAHINGIGERWNASFFRLGTRVSKGVRYFPPKGESLPFQNLPPLPHIGIYCAQYFNDSLNLIGVDEHTFIVIPFETCRFSDGSRAKVLRR